MKKNEIRVLYKRPGKNLIEVKIPNELEWLQGAVEGHVEAVRAFDDVALLVNEEGKLKGMERNFNFLGEEIVGPAVFVGVADEEFTDCPVSVSFLKQQFPEMRGAK